MACYGYGGRITKLIEEFSKLPGIGGRSAQRLAFYVINQPQDKAEALARAIVEARRGVKYCSVCCNLTDEDPCPVCEGGKRDGSVIMVVEDPRDMAVYERTGQFNGMYHVLHGTISPMNGVGPSDLKIRELLARLGGGEGEGEVDEVILATNTNVEGEATAMYIGKLIKPLGISATRIARGVPVGGDLEFIDDETLSRALEGRREI